MTLNPIPKPKKKTEAEKCSERLTKRREAEKRWRDKATARKRQKAAHNRKVGKHTTLSKRSKRVNKWNYIRTKILKPMFKKLGITHCEITHHLFTHGMISKEQARERDRFLGFAHRHKRVWYRGKEELLGDYNQVLLLGQHYHDDIEHNKELTERWFTELRGEEEL